VLSCTTEQLIFLRDDQTFRAVLDRSLAADSARIVGWQPREREQLMSCIRTFIVHGHDRALLFELKDYLQNTLGLPEPIVLEQQPDGGRTIIEKSKNTRPTST
jgi:predicted nucleotide-binding protein